MKYKNYLDDILGQKSKIKALRHMVKFPDGVSVRELSRKIGITEPNLSAVLKDLEKNNILVSRRHGTSLVFRLNKGHYLADEVIIPIFRKERSAIDFLGHYFAKNIKTGFISLILFGSVARGEERPHSDLDLAFIVSTGRDGIKLEKELSELGPAIIEKFGNMVSPYILTKQVFMKKLKASDHLTGSIASEGRVLWGSRISEML